MIQLLDPGWVWGVLGTYVVLVVVRIHQIRERNADHAFDASTSLPETRVDQHPQPSGVPPWTAGGGATTFTHHPTDTGDHHA